MESTIRLVSLITVLTVVGCERSETTSQAPIRAPRPSQVEGESQTAIETTSKITQELAVAIALDHLKIDKVTEEVSDNFNLRVSTLSLAKQDAKDLLGRRLGKTRHEDLSDLPDTFEVYRIEIQHGLNGDSIVYVMKDGGKIILVKFILEG